MWFTETPWPPILICLILAVLLFAGWFASRRSGFLAGIPGLAVLSVLIYVGEQQIVTNRERVLEQVYDITSAFQRGDLEGTLELVSVQAPEIRALITGAMQIVEVEDDLRITDESVTLASGETRATTHFRANATVALKTGSFRGHQPSRWELTWQLEAGEWRVIDVQRLKIMTRENINLFDRTN